MNLQPYMGVSNMKIVCVCGHIIDDEDDQRMHAFWHALSTGFTLTRDERAFLVA